MEALEMYDCECCGVPESLESQIYDRVLSKNLAFLGIQGVMIKSFMDQSLIYTNFPLLSTYLVCNGAHMSSTFQLI